MEQLFFTLKNMRTSYKNKVRMSCIQIELFDDVSIKCSKNIINIAVSVDVQVDRFGKVEAEDSHDGFCVDYVSSGYQIEIKIEFGNVVDERFYFVDRIKRNLYCFHVCNPPCYLVNIIYYPHLTALSYRLEGKKSMRKHTKIKWNLRDF